MMNKRQLLGHILGYKNLKTRIAELDKVLKEHQSAIRNAVESHDNKIVVIQKFDGQTVEFKAELISVSGFDVSEFKVVHPIIYKKFYKSDFSKRLIIK